MGLFGKKIDIPDGIRVNYYEGELKEFPCNYPCQILLMDDVLRITKVNPYVEVKLERSRITSIDTFTEKEYMTKYKGTTTETTKAAAAGIHKYYFVVNYIGKDGESRHLDLWGTSSEVSKVTKMQNQLLEGKTSTSYEI